MALLQNKSGQFVAPGGKGGEEALASVKLPADLRAWLPDPEGAHSLSDRDVHLAPPLQENADPKKAAALRELVDYCLTRRPEDERADGLHPAPGQHFRDREESGRKRPVTLKRAAGRELR
jgi:phosphate transport system substrate-binding protein